MNWNDISYDDSVFTNSKGQILGRIIRTYRTYEAHYKSENLGEYISKEWAKAAVEEKHDPRYINNG